jgi:hypothetical protein
MILTNGLMGIGYYNWRWLIHPFKEPFESTAEKTWLWFCDSDEYLRLRLKPLWKILLNWRTLTLMGIGIYFSYPLLLAHLDFNIKLVTDTNFYIALLLVINALLGFYLISKLMPKLSTKLGAWLKAKFIRFQKRRLASEARRHIQEIKLKKQREEQKKRDIESLNCRFVPEKVTLKTLPQDKVTLKLRFYNLKTRVCRPFAGN